MLCTQNIWQTVLNVLFPRSRAHTFCDTLQATTLDHLAVRPNISRLTDCLAPLPYRRRLVRMVIHAAKYHNHKHAAALLGEVVATHLIEELADRRLFGSYTMPYILPIPLHPKRQTKRGFNQSERIARACLSTLDDESTVYAPHLLERVVHTGTQTQQHDRATRIKNMRNAFQVPTNSTVEGMDIILIDDVITSGATLSAAKRALKAAGARNVLCVAAAQ